MRRPRFDRTPWKSIGLVILTSGGAAFACLTYLWIQLPDVRTLRNANPTSTAFMRLREAEAGRSKGRTPQPAFRWVPYRQIAPALARAVVVAEDGRFWSHDGVDFDELRIAVEDAWARGAELRGASTITQQLAKNLYLSPSRHPLRKAAELMIARRLEAELSKTRILEIYLNVIEWGDGIWGAEAASRAYFGVPAAALTVEQAALLAAAIINPRIYSPAHPNARLRRRQQTVLARMGAGVERTPVP
ncbi:MAG: monofunctional biosynthetic peptidoglycan transglycosylase [Acidobacteria bacterium]|nr:monofunctional biosynthetic peptidoglycan transglycosylase [Acidobacteriota bacterium]